MGAFGSVFEIKPLILDGARKVGFATLFFVVRRGRWHLENGVALMAWRRTSRKIKSLMGNHKVDFQSKAGPLSHALSDMATGELQEDGQLQEHHSILVARIKAQGVGEAAKINASSTSQLSAVLLLLSALILVLIVTLTVT